MNRRILMVFGVVAIIGFVGFAYIINLPYVMKEGVKTGDGEINLEGSFQFMGRKPDGTLEPLGTSSSMMSAYFGSTEVTDLQVKLDWTAKYTNIDFEEFTQFEIEVRCTTKVVNITTEESFSGPGFNDTYSSYSHNQDVVSGVYNISLSEEMVLDHDAMEMTGIDALNNFIAESAYNDTDIDPLDALGTLKFFYEVEIAMIARGTTEVTPIIGRIFGEPQDLFVGLSGNKTIALTMVPVEDDTEMSSFTIFDGTGEMFFKKNLALIWLTILFISLGVYYKRERALQWIQKF